MTINKNYVEDMISETPWRYPLEWIRSLELTFKHLESILKPTETEIQEAIAEIEAIRYSIEVCKTHIAKYPKSEFIGDWENGVKEAELFLKNYEDKIKELTAKEE